MSNDNGEARLVIAISGKEAIHMRRVLRKYQVKHVQMLREAFALWEGVLRVAERAGHRRP